MRRKRTQDGPSTLVTALFNGAATSCNLGLCDPEDAIAFAFDHMQERYPVAFMALCAFLEEMGEDGSELLAEAFQDRTPSAKEPRYGE